MLLILLFPPQMKFRLGNDVVDLVEVVITDATSEIIANSIDIAADLDNEIAIAIFTSKEISVVDDFGLTYMPFLFPIRRIPQRFN
jgi:hypothetical protein